MHVSESISSITLIFDQKLHKRIRDRLARLCHPRGGGRLRSHNRPEPDKDYDTPGCIINFYNQIARRHVNIEDTVSCHTDTIIVVRMKEVGKAFTALTDLITEERKRLEMRAEPDQVMAALRQGGRIRQSVEK